MDAHPLLRFFSSLKVSVMTCAASASSYTTVVKAGVRAALAVRVRMRTALQSRNA